MPTDDSADTFKRFLEASQKFDYFITGAAGSALLYAVQSYNPTTDQAVEVFIKAAWGLLLFSTGSGLWNLSVTVGSLQASHAQKGSASRRALLWKTKSDTLALSGGAVDVTEVLTKLDQTINQELEADKSIAAARDRYETQGIWSRHIRNIMLFSGLAVLTIARMLS